MDTDDQTLPGLRDELALARAEEAEALRRAHHLRAMGSSHEIRDAMRQVDVHRSRVTQLVMQVRALQAA